MLMESRNFSFVYEYRYCLYLIAMKYFSLNNVEWNN